jgi:PilZ domain-containing protein
MGRNRRKSFRVEWNAPATIYDADRHLERPCILSDLSNTGAKLSGVRAGTIPDEFRLRVTYGDRRARTCRVIWRTDHTLGVEFIDRVGSDADSPLKETLRESTP